jgi:hypothetical protein
MYTDIKDIVESADNAHEECDCIKLDEQIEALVDSDEPWTLSDNVCGAMVAPDEVELSIRSWIKKLSDAGYYTEDAERAVYDAMAALIENNMIPDAPDYDVPLPTKNVWIERFNNAMPTRLIALGIDLNG